MVLGLNCLVWRSNFYLPHLELFEMTRAEKIEIMAAELAKSEQMTLADCRRWIERCVVAVEAEQDKEVTYDPPSGWRYGFPRLYLPLDGETLEQTLLRDGYPQAEIDKGMANHCRFLGSAKALAKLEAA